MSSTVAYANAAAVVPGRRDTRQSTKAAVKCIARDWQSNASLLADMNECVTDWMDGFIRLKGKKPFSRVKWDAMVDAVGQACSLLLNSDDVRTLFVMLQNATAVDNFNVARTSDLVFLLGAMLYDLETSVYGEEGELPTAGGSASAEDMEDEEEIRPKTELPLQPDTEPGQMSTPLVSIPAHQLMRRALLSERTPGVDYRKTLDTMMSKLFGIIASVTDARTMQLQANLEAVDSDFELMHQAFCRFRDGVDDAEETVNEAAGDNLKGIDIGHGFIGSDAYTSTQDPMYRLLDAKDAAEDRAAMELLLLEAASGGSGSGSNADDAAELRARAEADKQEFFVCDRSKLGSAGQVLLAKVVEPNMTAFQDRFIRLASSTGKNLGAQREAACALKAALDRAVSYGDVDELGRLAEPRPPGKGADGKHLACMRNIAVSVLYQIAGIARR